MEKLRLFIAKWQSTILVVLFFLFFLGQCSTNRTVDKMRKDNLKLSVKIDSLGGLIKSYTPITKKDLQLEGLKSEKRMIQSIDRKLLDVNRQSEIDKEIEKLQSK
jgi:hypothetical protein